MTLTAIVIFAAALVVAAGSPGPSVAALVARTLMYGWRDILPFLAAMWFGEVIWLTFAVFGLAALAATFHWAFVVIKYAGVVYLLFLAWKMWRAPVHAMGEGAPPRGSAARMFLTGISVTLGNPKIMVFYVALLPTIIDLHAVSVLGWAELVATMLVALAFVDLSYVLLAHTARGFLRSPRAMRLTNRLGAAVFGGAAVAIATR
jgi:threonine/homoserine/homoserine lactone efflux protein